MTPRVWPLKPPHDKLAFREYLQALNNKDKPNVPLIEAELKRCIKYPAYFIMTHCFTKDEHDPVNPVKRFPRYKYIPFLIRELARYNRVAIPKSRQVMITWTVLAHLLYRAVYRRHQMIFIQSKKEEDAAALVDRVKHMYEHLPWWIHAAAPLRRPLHKQPFNRLAFANGSLIWGVPQGADVLRQYTASIVFQDEGAFQDRAEEAYNASKPTVEGGGQYIIVSSANGRNFFYRIVADKIDAPERELAA